MATIVTRAGKGSPLTHNEVDANFTNLNTDKLELSDLTNEAAVKALNQGVATTDSPTFAAIDVTGTVTADGLTVETSTASTITISENTGVGTASLDFVATSSFPKTKITTDIANASLAFSTIGNNRMLIANNGDISFYEDTGTTPQMVWDASADALTFKDNVKATFGAGSDLQIYHDGLGSYIDEVGTGSLYIRGTNLVLASDTGETYMNGTANGAVTLRYDNSQKLATTSTGVDVTGTVTADGLTIQDASPFLILKDTDSTGASASGAIKFNDSDNSTSAQLGFLSTSNSDFDIFQAENAAIDIWTNSTQRMSIEGNGDISFYEDTGTTPKLVWKAADERLGLGTSSPAADLHISSSFPSIRFQDTADYSQIDANSGTLRLLADAGNANANSSIQMHVDGTEHLRITSSGNVGIGTSSTLIDGLNARVLAETTASAANSAFVAYHPTAVGGRSIASFFSNKGSVLTKVAEIDTGGSAFFDGDVGIGTSSPANELHINKNATNSLVTITSGNSSTAGIEFGDQDDVNAGYIYYNNSENSMSFRTNGAGEDMRITSSGNVGIGTSSPITNLHISGTGLPKIRVEDTDTNGGYVDIFANGAAGFIDAFDDDGTVGTLVFRNGGSEAMRITSQGNVGIGTSSPTGLLTIGSTLPRLDFWESDGSAGFDNTILVRDADVFAIQTRNGGTFVSNDYRMTANASGALTHEWRIGNTERLRIDSSGTLLVAKTSDNTTDVGHVLGSTGYLYTTRASNVCHVVNRTGSDGDVVQYRNDNTTVGSVSVSGSTTSYNTSSDYRLKENVTTLDGAAYRLEQIPVHRFNFIADPDTTVDGFLAHEVQEIVPEAVTGEKDAVDADGNPVYQGIDQSKLVPLLTAALQEALQKIDALEARVATLEAN